MTSRTCAALAASVALSLSLSSPCRAEEPAASAPETTTKAEKKAQSAGTKATETKKVDVVATEEGEEGVKTYQFGAVEVEGRLRSPQILHFLRRVRAEFSAAGLGHRSFLLELSDTHRHSAFR